MHLIADYHTHTRYSDGQGGIEDNVKVAINKGLKEIAITDHGLSHRAYGITKQNLIEMRNQIDALKIKYPQINILLGVEANIISSQGDIDVTDDILPYLDIVIVGFHKTAKATNIKEFFKFVLPNLLKIKTKRQVKINTMAYINMLEKYDIISCVNHLHYACKVDAVEVAKHCKKHNVYVELNGKQTNFTSQEMQELISLETKFLINSDAHTPQDVANTVIPTNVAIMNQVPHHLVHNWNRTANLKQIHKKD